MKQNILKPNLFSLLVCLFASPAFALSCQNEPAFDQILLTGQVIKISSADGYLSPREVIRKHAEIEKARFQKTSVIHVQVEKVLKGGVSRGSVVQVIIPPGWAMMPEGEKMNVDTGAILIGARRSQDNSFWWSDCYAIWQGSTLAQIDWDGSANGQWGGYRNYLKVWETASQLEPLLDGRAPAAVSLETSKKVDALMTEIKDFDRLLDFHRKRYYVQKNVVNGADYAFALLKAGEIDAAKALLQSLIKTYGTSPEISAVENMMELVAGRSAGAPLRNISGLSFRERLMLDKGVFRGQRIVNVKANDLSAASAKFQAATLSDVEALKGILVDADFSSARLLNVGFADPYRAARPGTYDFDARRVSFRGASLENVILGGDFSQGDFSNISGRQLDLSGSFGEANFDNAVLDQVEITKSDLRGASMKGMRLKNSRFSSVDLRGVDFTGTVIEGKTEWNDVEHDASTLWPNGELPAPLKPRPPLVLVYP